MKCPHCNQEHSDDTKFCPNTGKEIELLACQNENCPDFGKNVLPPDSQFCPECGRKLMSKRGIDRICSGIDLSGFRKLIASVDEYILSTFFPITGITLGKTTLEERLTEYECLSLEEDDTDDEDENCVYTSYGTFWANDDGIFERYVLTTSDSIPEKWADLGISWDSSQDDIVNILEPMDVFEIDKHKYSSDGDVCATPIFHHFNFVFAFSDGKISEIRVTWEP